MKLVVVSHKLCWESPNSDSGYSTDGGFPLQMKAISELFSETIIVVPCTEAENAPGTSPLVGTSLNVTPLSVPKSKDLLRKLFFPIWLAINAGKIWSQIRRADAVHAPIPGDVGTIGLLFALILKKPLFVRHCGNWFVQKTVAERFWKWAMEYFAGGRNVMLATGGADHPPSDRNANIKWIFSTSLTNEDLEKADSRKFPVTENLRLITACRLEPNKGVEVVIESMPSVLELYPQATLAIVGDGSLMNQLRTRVEQLDLIDNVIFHGKVVQTQVIGLMEKAHIFCFPTSASEGFPKVVIEALSSGLPVITTKVSVLPSLVGHGSGVILESNDADSLVEGIRELTSSEDIYLSASLTAVSTARMYSLERWRDFIGDNLRASWNVDSLSSPNQAWADKQI